MMIAFCAGSSSNRVIEKLSSVVDNITFRTYDNMEELVTEAILRHIDFERIVFTSKFLSNPEDDLRKLQEFLTEYSNNTELVMLEMSEESGSEKEKLFNSFFSSPMYTVVKVKQGSMSIPFLTELVKTDIPTLKVTYGGDVHVNDSVVVAKSAEEQVKKEDAKKSVVSAPKKKKVGFFGKLFGGKSEESEENESSSDSTEEVPESTGNVDESAMNAEPEINSLNQSVVGGVVGDVAKDVVGVEMNFEENSRVEDAVPVVSGLTDGSVENFSPEDDELGLSIGDYGAAHSDTSFLDDSDEEELENYSSNREEDNNSSREDVVSPVEDSLPDQVEVDPYEKVFSDDMMQGTTEEYSFDVPQENYKNIDIIISNTGSKAIMDIIDSAAKYSDDGNSVLVVDVDNIHHRVLSFIDCNQFYKRDFEYGVDSSRIYVEDGVSFVSNGYGNELSMENLESFLEEEELSRFDIVMVDIPVESIGVLNMGILQKCNILIECGSDVSDLINMSLDLTDRSKVSLEMERYIMSNCDAEMLGGVNEETIKTAKESCFFANGCWLDNIR